ncbi:uncharacterized protein LOC141656292 [Silene latifolia]|uniref:uncharacterized protein LOC141656292 n=1 Tax=Silene latifolia TaxID=37657 RepID=UPI003D78A5EB
MEHKRWKINQDSQMPFFITRMVGGHVTYKGLPKVFSDNLHGGCFEFILHTRKRRIFGRFTGTAWAGDALNLVVCMLFCHVKSWGIHLRRRNKSLIFLKISVFKIQPMDLNTTLLETASPKTPVLLAWLSEQGFFLKMIEKQGLLIS